VKVLLLAQAPCTAGTFITKFICERLNPDYLIAESNPWSLYFASSKQDFNPLYPAFFSAASGLLSHSSHLEIFSACMDKFLKIASDNSSRLVVIRDHIFSEFFISNQSLQKTPYWVQYLALKNIDFRVLFTVRHPLDSYLGLKHSFPGQAKDFTLQSYSECYINAFTSYANSCKISLLSIEDLSEKIDAHEVILDLLSWARKSEEVQSSELSFSSWDSSGASGRASSRPIRFTRRLFGSSIRREVISSPSFAGLCAQLGYKSMFNELDSARSKLFSIIVDVYSCVFLLPGAINLLSRLGISRPVV